jgi:peptide deformylase
MLKVVAYGHPLLRKESEDIDKDYPNLDKLIEDMFETMKESSGVGLAAPQIGLNINLFIIDTTVIKDNKNPVKKVFINPEIIEFTGDKYPYEEGCLSIPQIREEVVRDEKVLINYLDENFEEHEEYFDGINARVIQHEYDHLLGVMFVDRVSSLKKRMLKRKLKDISEGRIEVDYPMIFYKRTKK